MSHFVEWIAAEGDDGDPAGSAPIWQGLPTHNFPARKLEEEAQQVDERFERNPDLWMYRPRTVALLRRYLRFSLETGRLPGIGGCEFFRAKVTAYKAVTFEDRVIFVRDVEKCLQRLEYWDQQLIICVVLQEHDQGDAAQILQCTPRTVQRKLPEVLDELSEDFLECELLTELPVRGRRRQ